MERVGNKCGHGVYWPVGDPVNLGCQLCDPTGYLREGPSPVLSRTEETPQPVSTNCTKCGNVRTYSTPNCRVCGQPFPETDLRGHDSQNKKTPGACQHCGCSAHYETAKKSMWQCSECLKEFRAPKNQDEIETDD